MSNAQARLVRRVPRPALVALSLLSVLHAGSVVAQAFLLARLVVAAVDRRPVATLAVWLAVAVAGRGGGAGPTELVARPAAARGPREVRPARQAPAGPPGPGRARRGSPGPPWSGPAADGSAASAEEGRGGRSRPAHHPSRHPVR